MERYIRGRDMICIAICDDDVKEAERVGRLVEKCCRKKKTICRNEVFCDGRALFYEVEEGRHYDILLLDIEMSELNGIELTSKVKKYLPDAITIFVSSYEQYVYKSFEVQPYRFIPKRDAGKMLPAAVEDALGLALEREGKFYIAENQKVLEKIPLKSITYIWHREKYAYIEKSNKEHTKVRKTLRQVYKELPEEDFAWVDRVCIVNLAQILRITGDGIILGDGTQLGAGREKIGEMKDRLRRYWVSREGLR